MKKWRAVFLICVSLTPLFAQGNVDNYSNVALSYDVNYEIAKIDGTTIDTTLNSMGAAWNIFTFKSNFQNVKKPSLDE